MPIAFATVIACWHFFDNATNHIVVPRRLKQCLEYTRFEAMPWIQCYRLTEPNPWSCPHLRPTTTTTPFPLLNYNFITPNRQDSCSLFFTIQNRPADMSSIRQVSCSLFFTTQNGPAPTKRVPAPYFLQYKTVLRMCQASFLQYKTVLWMCQASGRIPAAYFLQHKKCLRQKRRLLRLIFKAQRVYVARWRVPVP